MARTISSCRMQNLQKQLYWARSRFSMITAVGGKETQAGPGKLIKIIHGGILPTDVQYSILLGVHGFLHKLMNRDIAPHLEC